jgi:hypothetical protein
MGATLKEVQDIFLAEGCMNAGFLDGGASSELVVDGKLQTKPASRYGERRLPDGFLVFADPGSYKADNMWAGLTKIDAGGAYDNPGYQKEQADLRAKGLLSSSSPTPKPTPSNSPQVSNEPGRIPGVSPKSSPTTKPDTTPVKISPEPKSSVRPNPSPTSDAPSAKPSPSQSPRPSPNLLSPNPNPNPNPNPSPVSGGVTDGKTSSATAKP